MEAFDWVLGFVTVAGSSVDNETSATLITTSGVGTFNFDEGDTELDDEKGERGDDQEMFGSLGVLGRPQDPETIGGKDYRAEAVAARTADGLVPMSWRDLRLDRFFPNGLPKGAIRMVGYGGAFSGFDVKEGTSGASTENFATVAYVPYEYSGGVAQKAHSIFVDPDPANGITLTHGTGWQVALTEEGIMMRTPDAETFFQLKEGEFNVAAAKIFLKGACYVGAAAEAGIPLLPGPASPPCPSLFLSPQ